MYDINGGIEYHEKKAVMNENHAYNLLNTSRKVRHAPRKYQVECSHVRLFERVKAEVGRLSLLVDVNLLGEKLHDGTNALALVKADLCTEGRGTF